MKIILHTEFDIFTYKAAGAAVGILIYVTLAYKLPQIDLLAASVIAFSIGSFVWYLLSFIVIKRNGLCIEFRYSKNRPGFASVTLSKQFTQLDFMEFRLPSHAGTHNREFNHEDLVKFEYFFIRHLSEISDFNEIHFVGCAQRDADKISKMFKK